VGTQILETNGMEFEFENIGFESLSASTFTVYKEDEDQDDLEKCR